MYQNDNQTLAKKYENEETIHKGKEIHFLFKTSVEFCTKESSMYLIIRNRYDDFFSDIYSCAV